eukprot:scaffold30697_cov28-Tisochrysis_lutea.AAC.3
MSLTRVDLPIPLAPTMPSTAPGGISKLRLRKSERLPYDLETPCTVRTYAQKGEGEGDERVCGRACMPDWASLCSAKSRSYERSRARERVRPPLGLERIHCSSVDRREARASSRPCSRRSCSACTGGIRHGAKQVGRGAE